MHSYVCLHYTGTKQFACRRTVYLVIHNNALTHARMDTHILEWCSSSVGPLVLFCWGLSQLQHWQFISEESTIRDRHKVTNICHLIRWTSSSTKEIMTGESYADLKTNLVALEKPHSLSGYFPFTHETRNARICFFFNGKVVSSIIYGIFDLMKALRKW